MTATTDTLSHRLLGQAQQRPTAPAYLEKVNGAWATTDWRTYAEQVRTAARALIALGYPRGSSVAIIGFNRPEWVITDHATMMAGGAPAGIYTTCSAEQIQYITGHCEAHVIVLENKALLDRVLTIRDRLPKLKYIVLMRGAEGADEAAGILSWDSFMARGKDKALDTELDARLASLTPEGLATLIYTSGTTGPPKAVMLTHANLSWTGRMLVDIGGGRPDDTALSYLPLAHIAEQMSSIALPCTAGGHVYFAESLEKLADNLKDARPTVFFAVPRVWEKLHAGVAAKLAQATGHKAKLLEWVREVNTQVNAVLDRGESIPFGLQWKYKLATKLVTSKLKAAIGLDRGRWLISGAAPIANDVLEFFTSLDLPIREIYGQSEDSGTTSSNIPGRTRLGSVGPSLPGMEVKLAPDGEILIKGPNVFAGYYKEPQATAETLVDGWLHSGDLGAFDSDGYLSITGRKKEIIITSGGKNIAPKNIEAALKESPLIGEVVVIGDRRKFLTALVTLADGASTDKARDVVQAQLDHVNKSLSRVEQVKKFSILARPFGIETGELTPTLKIKRTVVAEKYAAEIEAMYAGAEAEA